MLNYNLSKIIGFAVLVCLFFSAAAQPVNFVVLSKEGKKKKYEFMEGEEIRYKLKANDYYFTDKIVKIKDSAIEFMDYSVRYSDIDKIYIQKRKHIIPNKTVLLYGANVLAAAGILEIAYLINTGKGVHNLGTQVLILESPVPVFLLINWLYGMSVKNEYTIAEGEYRLRPVILRND